MEDYLVLIFVFGIVILISSFFSKKAIVKRKLKQAKHKRISEFLDGDVAKITGTVELINEPLIAPLSKRKCSYYYVHIERKNSSKNSTWQTYIEEEVSGNFLIKDEFGYACIKAPNVKSYIVQDKNYSSGFLNDTKQHLENYLASKGKESVGLLGFNKTLRYNEGILEPNEKVAVFGKGQWKDAKSLDLSEDYRMVLEITGYDNKAVYISDDLSTTSTKSKRSFARKIIDILTR